MHGRGKNDGQQRLCTPTYKWHLKKDIIWLENVEFHQSFRTFHNEFFFVQISVHFGWKVHSHRWNLTLPNLRTAFFKCHLYMCPPPNKWWPANEMVANYVQPPSQMVVNREENSWFCQQISPDPTVSIRARKKALEGEKAHLFGGMCEHLGRTCLLAVSVVLCLYLLCIVCCCFLLISLGCRMN